MSKIKYTFNKSERLAYVQGLLDACHIIIEKSEENASIDEILEILHTKIHDLQCKILKEDCGIDWQNIYDSLKFLSPEEISDLKNKLQLQINLF